MVFSDRRVRGLLSARTLHLLIVGLGCLDQLGIVLRVIVNPWFEVFASPLGIVYVFLAYGLAFIGLGLVSIWQARSPIRVLPAGPLWFLGGFGVLHGAHEWVELGLVVESDFVGIAQTVQLQFANFVLVVASFALLMQSGVDLLVVLGRRSRYWRIIPLALLLALAIVLFAIEPPFDDGNIAWLAIAEAVSRYLLGFTGSIVVAYSLFLAGRRQHGARTDRIKAYLTWSAAAFAVYGVFTGLVVSPAAFPPAAWLNTETFQAAIGVPAQLFRAGSAFAIGFLLSEVFVVEAGRVRWELDREREEFISVVAHDMRSPIAAININAEVLERSLPGPHEINGAMKPVSNIRASARHLNRMVGDLLDASRVEAHRLALTLEKVDPDRLLPDMVERAAELTKGHPVRIRSSGRPLSVKADPGRFEQVVNNLLSNAAKYSYPGTEIIIAVEEHPTDVVCSVTNYGRGISSDDQLGLFRRFNRVAAAERADVPGLGLGLYIAKGLVEAHGGRIWVESEVGRYTTFSFALPRALA